jgi:hypothetical protein
MISSFFNTVQWRSKCICFVLLALIMVTLTRCQSKPTLNQRITLWRGDKIPYGTKVLYDWLTYQFPEAQISPVRSSPSIYKNGFILQEELSGFASDEKLRVIVSSKIIPDHSEWIEMMNQVSSGTDYFLSSFYLSPEMQDSLRISLSSEGAFWFFQDSLKVSVLNPATKKFDAYVYPGLRGHIDIDAYDSSITEVLGLGPYGKPNYLRIRMEGGGSFYVHSTPLALSNFFLLHKQNATYMEKVFSYVHNDNSLLMWDDYFRNNTEGKKNEFSRLEVIMREEGLRWAFFLILFIFLLLFLLETKRKESIIPPPPVLRNNAGDYVSTLSELYFQQKDHANLAEKIMSQFYEHILKKYFIKSAQLSQDASLVSLSARSGVALPLIKNIIYNAKMLQHKGQVSPEELLALHQYIEQFYLTEKNIN